MGETTVRVGQRWRYNLSGVIKGAVVTVLEVRPDNRVVLQWPNHTDSHWEVHDFSGATLWTLVSDAPAEVKLVERDLLDTPAGNDGFPVSCIVCGGAKTGGFGCTACFTKGFSSYDKAAEAWTDRRKARKEGAVTGNTRPPGTGAVPPPPSETHACRLGAACTHHCPPPTVAWAFLTDFDLLPDA